MRAAPGGVTIADRTRIDPRPASERETRAPGAEGTRALEFAWYAAALAVVVAWGILRIPVPLHRDSALFLWTAIQMDQGAVLYRDVWDVKQPGVFVFHLLAGRLFGFTPEAVHLFELIWQLVLSVVLIAALRPLLRHAWLAAVAPVAVLAGYLVYANPDQQTQLEILVALPLFACAALIAGALRGSFGTSAALFAAGLAAGVATAFKHLLAPIPVAFLLAATVAALAARPRPAPAAVLMRMWLPFAAGVIVVWGGIGLAFWSAGALDAFLWTTFGYPVDALSGVVTAPISRLAVAVAIWTAAMAPWLFFALPALARSLRRDEPLLFRLMVVWLVLGALVVLIQKSSWWTYHLLLLYAPAGVLAARGLDVVVGWVRDRSGRGAGVPAMALSALMVLPILAGYGFPTGESARRLLDAVSAGGLEAYRRAVSDDYALAADATAALAPAPPGPIYVFGDPTILRLSGRRQSMPVQGSAWGSYLPGQWATLPEDLIASQPVWIFVETPSDALIRKNSPATMAAIEARYRLVWQHPGGRWYARNDPSS